MDWSRIKTIFIITFLLLDIFLGYEVYKKISNNELEILAEASIEEKLEAEEIRYGELPKEVIKGSYISAENKVFSEEELAQLKGQKISLSNFTTISSELEVPVKIPDKNQAYFLMQLIRDNVYKGDAYQYWGTNEQSKTIYFFQKYKDQVIYHNSSAMLELKYNEENEIVSYKQSMLDKITEMDSPGEKQELISAINALEILFDKNEIRSKSKVTKVELGYMKLIPEDTDVQVIAPTWRFVINDDVNVFVNAIEGQVVQIDSIYGVKMK